MIWRIFLLVWCFFILSQGVICLYTAWQMWKARKTHPVAYYTAFVMFALCLTTGLATYGFLQLLFIGGPRLVNGEIVYLKGLALFEHIPTITYINLIFQAFLSAALWAKGLYFANIARRVKRRAAGAS